jgi:hypothetical protein
MGTKFNFLHYHFVINPPALCKHIENVVRLAYGFEIEYMIADFICAFHQTNVWFREVEALTNQVSAAPIAVCRYGLRV